MENCHAMSYKALNLKYKAITDLHAQHMELGQFTWHVQVNVLIHLSALNNEHSTEMNLTDKLIIKNQNQK